MKLYLFAGDYLEEPTEYDDTEEGMREALEAVADLQDDGDAQYFIVRGTIGRYIPPQDKGSIVF